MRLPYDKNGRYCWMPFISRHFTDRGYAFLPQDVRGKFRSEGEVNAFVHEIDDGYDTIDWVSRQPWSNGRVGMWGDSYYGFTQWTAVASGHPALKAIVPRVTAVDLFDWLRGVTPLYGAHYLAQYWADGRSHHWTPDWSHRPLSEVFDSGFEVIGTRSIAFDRLLAEARGEPGVELYAGGHPFDRLRIPTLHGVGWFDNITPATCSTTNGWSPTRPRRPTSTSTPAPPTTRTTGSRRPRPRRRRPRKHDDALQEMLPRYLQPALDFFDAFLAGRSDPQSVARVRWHLGNDGWRTSPCWPPPGAVERGSTCRPTASCSPSRRRPAGSTGCTIPRTWCRRRSRTRSPSSTNTRTRTRSPPARTSSSSPATPAEPLTLAGRVDADLWVGSDGPPCSST